MSANADSLKQLKGRKLPVSYWKHVIEGSAVLRIRIIPVGSESQVYILAALGDSTNGYGWQGPTRVTYDGGDLAGTEWRFHPGTRSTGMADPVQGADDWFEGSIPYNGTPCIAVRLPVGAATSIDDAAKIVVICECQITDDFDITGAVTGHGISGSPARIVSDYGINRWGLPLSRFHWPSWVHYRDWCAAVISGGVPRFEASIFFVDEDFQTVLDRVCTVTCSEWQDYDAGDGSGMQIHMVTPEDRVTVHDFIDDEDGVNVPGTGNIVSGSLNVYPVDEKSLVNLITLTFKDLETDNYVDATVTCERPELRQKYGDVEIQIYLGPSTHYRAKRIGEFELARKTDYPTRGDWKGMGDSDHLVPGDLVRLISNRYGWVDGVKSFIVTSKEEDDSGSADAISYTFEERVNGIYRDDLTAPLPSIPEDTTIPNPYFPPPLIQSLSLSVQQNTDSSVITQTIIGLATFANYPRQHARVWIKRDTAPTFPYQEVTTIVPDSAGQAAFPIPNVGDPIIDVNYKVRVISESPAGTSLPFSAATEYPITVYSNRLPMPVNFAYRRISNDFVMTWEPGVTDIIELVERYILRIYNNATNALIRTHEIRLNDSIPCKWAYFTGGEDQSLISMDPDGSIYMGTHSTFDGLIYDSQPFYGDCDILFAVDNRHFIVIGPVNWPRAIPAVPTGTYIERWYNNNSFVDAEGATTGSFLQRISPHSQFSITIKNGQVEYYINEKLWFRSFQGPIQQTFVVSIALGYDILEPQALLKVRVRPFLPRQFVYTESMQDRDFNVAGGGVIPAHFRFEITQISSANVESDPAIIIT